MDKNGSQVADSCSGKFAAGSNCAFTHNAAADVVIRPGCDDSCPEWRSPADSACCRSVTARPHLRCRGEEPVPSSTSNHGVPAYPPRLACSVFSSEPKASNRPEPAADLSFVVPPQALNQSGIYVLPNAWDAGSAVLIERAGASVVATTSGGVSWAWPRASA